MKKLLRTLIYSFVAIFLFSCNKPAEDNLATITINPYYMESGSMYTRSIVPDIEEALSAIMPTEIPLTITRDDFKLSCLSGEEISLPYDYTYKVFGRSEQLLTNLCAARMYISGEPLITVDDFINVKYDVKEYCANATISSFVLAWNNTVVKSATLNGLTTGKIPLVQIGNTSLCCVTGEGTFDITLNPWENQPWEARTFTITSYPNGNGIYCEPGKWYALSPFYKPDTECSIGFQYESWTEGGNYY